MNPAQRSAGGPRAQADSPSATLPGHPAPRRPSLLFYSFALATLAAVAAGCAAAAAAAGVGPGVWGRNAAAWVMGAAIALPAYRARAAPSLRAVLPLTATVLLLSLFSAGQSGVHRWITLGPLHWNAAFLLLPAATVALAMAAGGGGKWMWAAAAAIQLELCLQPDASQASAFAAAIAAILLTTRREGRRRLRLAASLLFVAAAAFTWTRPDPLAPVPEVEGVLRLAGSMSGGLAALCVLAQAAAAACPLLAMRSARGGARPAAIGLAVYFSVCALMPLFGEFPVPLAGMGMSPILGYWLGVAALLTVCDSE